MPLNIEQIRQDFPIFQRETKPGTPLVYLDSTATSQKPLSVIEAMDNYYRRSNANIHRGVHTLAEEATAMYEQARVKIARRSSGIRRRPEVQPDHAPSERAALCVRSRVSATDCVRSAVPCE